MQKGKCFINAGADLSAVLKKGDIIRVPDPAGAGDDALFQLAKDPTKARLHPTTGAVVKSAQLLIEKPAPDFTARAAAGFYTTVVTPGATKHNGRQDLDT